MGSNGVDAVEEPPSATLSQWVGVIPAVLTVFGALLYGALTIAYDRFYTALGTSPADVGFSYGSTLTRSSGLVALFALLVPVALLYFRRARSLYRLAYDRMYGEEPWRDSQVRKLLRLSSEEGRRVTELTGSADLPAYSLRRGSELDEIYRGAFRRLAAEEQDRLLRIRFVAVERRRSCCKG